MTSRGEDGGAQTAEQPGDRIEVAVEVARRTLADLNESWSGQRFQPHAEVRLTSGSDDERVLAVTLWIALEDDFDPGDFPTAVVRELKDELCQRLGSRVGDLRWYALVNNREPAAV